MTNNEIKEAVVRVLDGAGFRVFDEDVTSTHLELGPLVLVTIEPVAMALSCGGIQRRKSMIVDCAYLHGQKANRAAMYDALEAMNDALVPAFTVGDRRLKPDHVRNNITDGVAHLIFDLDFFDLAIESEPEEMIKTLNIGGILNGNA